MIRDRAPLPKANAEEMFINKGNPNDLSGLDLEQLAQRYVEIDAQSQLLKGLILLEARNRFESDREFGAWVQSTQALCLGGGQPARTRYMNLARFFKDRDMTGISLTAAYEISRPDNAEIAEEIYIYALNKNLKVEDIKQKIELVKTSLTEDNKNEHNQDASKSSVKDKQKIHIKMIHKIANLLNSFELEANEKIALLEESIQNIKNELSEPISVSENNVSDTN